MMAENSLAGKQRALETLQQKMQLAHEKIEQQKMQLATLHGRSTALKLASEEAQIKGQSWDIRDVKRFTALPKGPPDFCNDALREMLDQAYAAADRRVRAAVADGSKARAESERAESEGEASLEDAFSKCKEPVAELAVRQAVEKLLVKSTRLAKRLRQALQRLEQEASDAQTTHAADLRSLGARLVAQRDASLEIVLSELERVETDGTLSLKSLQAAVAEAHESVGARDGAIGELQAELKDLLGALKQEKRERREEREEAARQAKRSAAEIAQLQAELATARHEGVCHPATLGAELAREETDRAADAAAGEQKLHEQRGEYERKVRALEAQLKQVKIEARTMHAELLGRLKAEARERQSAEQAHADALLVLEGDGRRKETFLRGKIEALGKQVRTLRASSSRGRAMLYWSSMKEAKEVRLAAEARGDADEFDDDDLPWPLTAAAGLGLGSPAAARASSSHAPVRS